MTAGPAPYLPARHPIGYVDQSTGESFARETAKCLEDVGRLGCFRYWLGKLLVPGTTHFPAQPLKRDEMPGAGVLFYLIGEDRLGPYLCCLSLACADDEGRVDVAVELDARLAAEARIQSM